MVDSNPSRATVHNKPGASVRKIEAARWLAALVTLIVLFAGIYLYGKNSKTIATLGLPVILVVAGGLLYWVKGMGDRGDGYSKTALDAQRGVVTDEIVPNLLGELPAGFFVVHDFLSKVGNIDHVLISKKGILTVDLKGHRGVVTWEGNLLRREGRPFSKDFLGQARAEALSVGDLLASHGLSAPRPQPVILFANACVQVRPPVRGVDIVSGRDFPVYLKRLQTRLSAREVEKIFDILKASQSQMLL